MTAFIGLGHYSRTGKDSLANAICRHSRDLNPDYRIQKIPFAWKLKDITHQLYGWAGLREPSYYDTPEGEAQRRVLLPAIGMTPVDIWVRFGTPAVRQQVYDRTWVAYVLNATKNLDCVVIPDVRFPNEVEELRAVGGTLVKVVRPGYGPLDTVADKALLGYDGWDYIIGGSGEMRELDAWGLMLARWLTGRTGKPEQPEEDMNYCLSVETNA